MEFKPHPKIKPVLISGREVWPVVEGGKGIAASNGYSAGAFAAAGAVGTFSGVNADSYEPGQSHPLYLQGQDAT
jgi:nitronate monooxygenase